ncbi:MAG: glycerophosphodiester phosphodiesterase [Geobacteraceae bacterium]|nr:glycerophosphodiester phosphodiesterase [Geobacteraceae bacterium]
MRDTELIGHRGASREAPENTLAAFRLAWEQGADGIEGDFRLTRDGEIVCLHDPTTRRTAGADLAVAGATLAELRELDAGGWKGAKWRGEPIPTLAGVIATVPPGKRLFIELKSGPEIVAPLKAILAASPLDPAQLALLSFSTEVVAEARQLLPHVKTLWITDYQRDRRSGEWSPASEVILSTLERIDATGLASQAHRSVDAAFVRALRAAGKEIHVWTVDSLRTARRFSALGVDSIITNRPGWLRERLQTPPLSSPP